MKKENKQTLGAIQQRKQETEKSLEASAELYSKMGLNQKKYLWLSLSERCLQRTFMLLKDPKNSSMFWLRTRLFDEDAPSPQSSIDPHEIERSNLNILSDVLNHARLSFQNDGDVVFSNEMMRSIAHLHDIYDEFHDQYFVESKNVGFGHEGIEYYYHAPRYEETTPISEGLFKDYLRLQDNIKVILDTIEVFQVFGSISRQGHGTVESFNSERLTSGTGIIPLFYLMLNQVERIKVRFFDVFKAPSVPWPLPIYIRDIISKKRRDEAVWIQIQAENLLGLTKPALKKLVDLLKESERMKLSSLLSLKEEYERSLF